jgi:signal transduction histidine kinase/ActR/RegA family two-component response regulator
LDESYSGAGGAEGGSRFRADLTKHVTRLRTPLVFVALALLLGIVGMSGWASVQQDALRLKARHGLQVGQSVERLLSLLQDAETGQRGYLLTGREDYLEPYERAVAGLPGELDTLERLTAGTPEQGGALPAIRRDAAAKMAELGETVRLARTGAREAAMAVVMSDRGKAAMDRARSALGALREQEARALAARQAENDRAGQLVRMVILASAAMIIVLGVLILMAVRGYTQELIAGRDAVAARNEALREEIETRRRLESQLVQSQKMEAVGQLTGGIAHDFNNMLAVVISALSLLKRKVQQGSPDALQFADAAMDGARRAAQLTNRLLAYSRQQPLSPEVVDANRMVANMSELLRRTLGEQMEIETVLAGGLWRTRADPGQLENSIINLAVNSRDAMAGADGQGGGRITIETGNAHLDDAYAASNHGVPPGQYVLVAVSDTGPGMSEEVLAKAFEPFFTTKPVGKGTGLGLSQVYGFVKQSGGHIKIYSEPGQGTAVKIYLPRAHVGEAGEAQAPVAVEAAAMHRADPDVVILVVEDDDHVRVVTVASLRELGYTVVHAGRPSDAIQIAAGGSRIDLVLSDVVMPEMNGRKMADEIVKLRPEVRVLFTTGYTQNAIVHNGVLDPGTDLLMKPFSVDQLAAKVAQVLGRK